MMCPAPSAAIAAQYETLRLAALGGVLPPESRGGLLLLQRRGMWEWARTLAAASVRQEPVPRPSSSPPATGGRGAAIHVLAAMVTSNNQRSAS